MVTAVTSFGRSGLSDWLIQRFSSVVLAAYSVFIVFALICGPEVTFASWSQLFDQLWVRIFTIMALLACAAHGWIGLWNVLTDYLTARLMGGKALALRMIVLTVYALVTASYLVWGVEILWGS